MEDKKTKIIILFWRVVLILAVFGLLFWLTWKNLAPSGQLEIVKDFCRKSNFISDFYPKNRASSVFKDENGKCFQRILIEPVYFKVKTPRTFERVKVNLIYQNPSQTFFQIGLMKKKITPLDWGFISQPLDGEFENDWQRAEVYFEIIPEALQNHHLEFILSAPFYQETEREIKISKIEISLERKKVTWINFYLDLKDYFIRRFQNLK